MCRNIRTLCHFEPPATAEEIRAAALRYVRKISGFARPSAANAKAFDRAVDEVAGASPALLRSLVTAASPKNREAEAARSRARALERFGAQANPRPRRHESSWRTLLNRRGRPAQVSLTRDVGDSAPSFWLGKGPPKHDIKTS